MLGMMYLSVRKPFGKRETKPFKYHNVVLAVSLLCVVAGSVVLIQSDPRMKKLRNYPIEDIDVSQVADGTYEGTADFSDYTYHVSVTVENHEITEIKDLAPRDSIYVTYATGVFRKIIAQQTPNVDAITGATTTSKAFMVAVENALQQGYNIQKNNEIGD